MRLPPSMFSTMDLDLRPYEENDSNYRVDWRAPITPKGYTIVGRLNRTLKLRNGHVDSEDDRHDYRRPLARNGGTRRAARRHVPKSLPDYAFIRRDSDYEDFVTEIWHDQIQRGWPKAIPYTTTQGINVAVRQCIKFISADDSAYYILLCGGIIGYTSSRYKRVNTKTLPRLFHKTRISAVKALRQAISELEDGMPTDSLMAGILSFALQETVYENDLTESPQWPTSPLARAQLLGWVGGLHSHSHHLEAFYQLLERRGGLHTVTEPGLRRMIYLCDLLTSSMTAASPRYPPYGSSRSLVASGKLELDAEASGLQHSFASKFKDFSTLSWQFLEPIIKLLPDLRDATLAVDMHQRTKGERPQLGELVDFANSVQWRILDLCNDYKDRHDSFSRVRKVIDAENPVVQEDAMMDIIRKQTLEPVRLAILIYSNLVIFPISFSAGVSTNLASLLRDFYECDQVRIFEPELELWILAMGALASWGTNDRGWYLEKLRYMSDELCWPDEITDADVKGPSQLKFLEIMRGFLWWEHVCSVPMREIWVEMYGNKLSHM